MEINAVALSTIVTVLALAIAAYAIFKMGKAGMHITSAAVTDALEDAYVYADELADVALTAAGAAEQLWRSGKIERSERLDNAFRFVRRWFPDLDEDLIVTALESAVLTVNSLVASLPARQ